MVAVLAGCAARQLHQDGVSLINEGRYELGLGKLEEAVKRDNADTQFRMSLYANRERVITQLLGDAEKAMAAGDLRAAETAYRRALAIAPQDVRIAEGIRLLEKRGMHGEMAKQAQAALKNGDLEQAESLAQKILSVDARHAQALDVRVQVERARAKEAVIPPQLKSRLTKPVNLEFRDANIKMVFDVLSRASGLNFIIDKEIKSDTKITIYVRNVAVEDAIDLMLVQSQLEKKVLSDNTVLIYPNTPQKLREYQDLAIRSFYLVNSDAKQTANLLKNILKIKDMHVDDRLNMIFVRDTPDTIRLAEKLIRTQDMAEPEVILEMEVMEINRTRAIELGVSWPDTFTWLVPNPANLTLDQLPFGQRTSRDRIGINNSMVLKMKQDNGIANLLSNPRIRVKNRDKARILVGDRVPIITATVTPGALNPVTTESISYLDVGLKLELEPTILLDDDVSIRMMLEVSTLGDSVQTNSGSVAYRVGTRTVSTSLRLMDGETQVLMGLIREEERDSASGLPGLMDLPVLGRLFSTPKNEKQKTEIALSITPRIVRNVRRSEAHEMEFWSGTEASMKARQPILQSAAAPAALSPAAARPSVPAHGTAAVETSANAAAAQGAATAQNSAAGQPLQLSWNAPESGRVGEQIVVAMVANAPTALSSAALSLKFDPRALELVKVEEGELLKQAGAETRFNHTADAAGGRVVVGVARTASDGVQGRGRLFNATFKVKAESAKSQIQLTSMSPLGPDNTAIPFSASGPLSIALKP
jgi:general secretion pathway protein D